MAKSGGRLSLFWWVYSATLCTMAIGAGAWWLAGAAQDAVGNETTFRAFAGVAIWWVTFFGTPFVISMVTYGALLSHYTVSPAPQQPGEKHAEPLVCSQSEKNSHAGRLGEDGE